MNNQIANSPAEDNAPAAATAAAVGTATSTNSNGQVRASARKPSSKSVGLGRNSKKDELIALLAKPKGTRVSVLVERLGWQPHTVRAALSGLRKQGIEITRTKAPKTGETVYAIVEPEAQAAAPVHEAAS